MPLQEAMRHFLALTTVALACLPLSFLVPAGVGGSHKRAYRQGQSTGSFRSNTSDKSADVARLLAGLAAGLLLGAASVSASPQPRDSSADLVASPVDCATPPREAQTPSALQEFVRASSQRRSEKRLKLVRKQLQEHGKMAIDKICFENEGGQSMRNM